MSDDKKKSGSETAKKILGAVAVTAGIGAGIYGATSLYNSFFGRYEKLDYKVNPGLYDYEKVKDKLNREEISFYSDNVRLQGYYYFVEGAKGLVVISHGLHAGGDDYLPITMFFVKNGYDVFSFDYKGTYNSDGKSTVGMSESLVDLNNALNFIKSDNKFYGLKIFLVGHSWGGFATAAVLSLQKGISAATCIAGFNSGYTLIREKGFQYGGELAANGIPKMFLDTYQKILFKDYAKYDAVTGINAQSIPVLLAHGKKDFVIDFNLQSIVCHANEIRNPQVQYYIGEEEQSGHDSIWHSKNSVAYKKSVDKKIKEIKKNGTEEDLIKYCSTIDDELYSEINYELFNKILIMFNNVL